MGVRELCGFRTRSPRMNRVLDLIQRFAALEAPVLIDGETGTGKERAAHALHALGPRSRRVLVAIDCGALPESIVETELFGHERGAFTGADRAYGGRVQSAAGGTLFLDEINSTPLPIQGKLLRFLQEGEFSRVGSQRPIPVDVRVVSASNIPLESLVASGRIRADFFYRLNVLRIDLPRLRDRREDIPLLVEQFVNEDALARQIGMTSVSDAVLSNLMSRPWPGNIRELLNFLRRAIVFGVEHGVLVRLPDDTVTPAAATAAPPPPRELLGQSLREWIRGREREYLASVLERYPTVTRQAEVAGLPQRTFYRKIRRYGLR
jgi:two-component system C4-dicarboxylate transport response regulator DctD